MEMAVEPVREIAIAGDVETMLMDTSSLEEMNPYQFFQAASLYTARLVNPAQAQAVIGTARASASTIVSMRRIMERLLWLRESAGHRAAIRVTGRADPERRSGCGTPTSTR